MPTTSMRARFDETHWSLIGRAGLPDESGAAALERLCQAYRTPLYSFVRRRGFSPADADDLVQGFFLDLVKREGIQKADRAKGRFRSFLLASVQNYLANELDRQRTLKRGGAYGFVPLEDAEKVYGELSRGDLAAEKLYDRAWALGILDRTLAGLRGEYEAQGRLELFEALEPSLSRTAEPFSYPEAARRLRKTEEAVRMATSRLRRRFREILAREVTKTLTSPDELESELRYLLSCL